MRKRFVCTITITIRYPGDGGYSTKVYTGRLSPEVQPLTLLYTIFWLSEKVYLILSYIFYDKWYPFHIPRLDLNIPVNCCKFTVFTCNTWINLKANSFSRFFHKTASFSPFGPFYRPKWQISLPEAWKRSRCESYDFHIYMTFISLHLQWGSKVLTLLQNDPLSEQWTYLSPHPV